jgi:hypothetical protein
MPLEGPNTGFISARKQVPLSVEGVEGVESEGVESTDGKEAPQLEEVEPACVQEPVESAKKMEIIESTVRRSEGPEKIPRQQLSGKKSKEKLLYAIKATSGRCVTRKGREFLIHCY